VWVFYLENSFSAEIFTILTSLYAVSKKFVRLRSLGGHMKLIVLFALLFPSLLLASETTYCSKKVNNLQDITVVSINDDSLNFIVNGVDNPFTIKEIHTATGEEAQEDADLIGEAIERSDAYVLENAEGEPLFLAVVKGVSGTSYLIEIMTTKTIGTTALCN
jgi:hypothetical protein